ncbi:MAG: DUF4982 domain-containing protein [Bacteroidales bacterium]|nr:DUF4982 domain-containing protein [Bacteroidales bacterium]
MKRSLTFLFLLVLSFSLWSRERIRFDEGWEFAFGHAADPARDFGCGTEYFNYLTKAASIHNAGPYSPEFDKTKWPAAWKTVNLPHDWVVDLPFAREASHSHGYKTVGYKYPETSVGWYRKTFSIPASDEGKHIAIQFDGIFRDARIWVNGFYLGHEPSGYATQVYDLSEYLNYGGENVVAVRVDATLEEGWFYEGAGIYRHVWLDKTDPVHVAPFGTFVHADIHAPYATADVSVQTTVRNTAAVPAAFTLTHTLLDADGTPLQSAHVPQQAVNAKGTASSQAVIHLSHPKLWDTEDPYLYRIRTEVMVQGQTVDSFETPFGIREAVFDADQGFLLNGKRLELKGVNLHQDHAGVGSAIPDALQVWRLKQLRELGVNAIRSSHNPMSPVLLDACDSLGILVMEENRLMGINEEHIRLLQRMIERDRNHPSVILWSVGNEEWGLEWNDKGRKIAESMREYCHRFDPTRPMSVATSSGPNIIVPVDVAGYNYVMQNPIDQHRKDYPNRLAVGSEETTGTGTRGVYFPDPSGGRMPALNRLPDEKDGALNRIERGWQFYAQRPWLGGLFWWTGFDYRGEPNPLEFPATGSEFGILDYCGFPKDEAWYLKAWWTEEPVLHLLPHWNLQGHEGEAIDIWVYGNCEEVELQVNGKRLGRKRMPQNGHLSWEAVYKPGRIKAIGYQKGRKVLEETLETTGPAARIQASADRNTIHADGRDLAVCTLRLLDEKGRFVPDACEELTLTVEGPARILGVGNGDPAWQASERPEDPEARTFRVRTFNGLAQVLLQSTENPGPVTLRVSAKGSLTGELSVTTR